MRTLATDLTTIRYTIKNHRGKISLLTVGAIVAGSLISAPLIANAASLQAEAEQATAVLSQQGALDRDHLTVYENIARFKAESNAKATITVAQNVLAAADQKVDASALTAQVTQLSSYRLLPVEKVVALTDGTKTAAQQTADAVTAHDAEVARQQAEAAAAAAAAAAEAARIANTPDGARAQGRQLAAEHGWDDTQFACLDQLWTKESNWRVDAYNGNGGATGIPQSLPGSKMAAAGPDWQTSARTQIIWGLSYIAGSYGSPCAAWNHSVANNWY